MRLHEINNQKRIDEKLGIFLAQVGNRLAGLFSRKKKARSEVLKITNRAFKAFDQFLGRRRNMSMKNVTWKILWTFMLSPQGLKMNEQRARLILKNADLKNEIKNAWTKIARGAPLPPPEDWGKMDAPIGGDTNDSASAKFAELALTYIFEVAATQYLEYSTKAQQLSARELKWLEKQGFDVSDLSGSMSSSDVSGLSAAVERGMQGEDVSDEIANITGTTPSGASGPATSTAPNRPAKEQKVINAVTKIQNMSPLAIKDAVVNKITTNIPTSGLTKQEQRKLLNIIKKAVDTRTKLQQLVSNFQNELQSPINLAGIGAYLRKNKRNIVTNKHLHAAIKQLVMRSSYNRAEKQAILKLLPQVTTTESSILDMPLLEFKNISKILLEYDLTWPMLGYNCVNKSGDRIILSEYATGGSTSSGSVASFSMPLGATIRRVPVESKPVSPKNKKRKKKSQNVKK
jgi:hypothetical protein